MWRALNGITLGYAAHALLASVGLAALVAASPALFETLRWIGVSYLVWIAFGMIRAAWRGIVIEPGAAPPLSIWRGFLTSFLNPKGLLMFFAVLPQFIDPSGNAVVQAVLLSAVFITLCYAVYALVGLSVASAAGRGKLSRTKTRIANAIGGTLLGVAAGRLATS